EPSPAAAGVVESLQHPVGRRAVVARLSVVQLDGSGRLALRHAEEGRAGASVFRGLATGGSTRWRAHRGGRTRAHALPGRRDDESPPRAFPYPGLLAGDRRHRIDCGGSWGGVGRDPCFICIRTPGSAGWPGSGCKPGKAEARGLLLMPPDRVVIATARQGGGDCPFAAAGPGAAATLAGRIRYGPVRYLQPRHSPPRFP